MGTFQVTIEIGDPQGERWAPVRALVDTGSTFTWAPRDLLTRLGVEPELQADFRMADGRMVRRDIAQTQVRFEGQRRVTIVVFGDPDSPALLGAYTLEGFLLAPDPVSQRLVPVPGLAM